jgi:signal transduction histidine kinase
MAATTALSGDDSSLADFFVGVGIFVVGPTFAGRMLNGRVLLARALRDRSERVATESADRIREARLAERTRIAGELHDVVAHALGAMTVQAAAARRMAAADTEKAGLALEAVETAGRGALGELRTLLDVLRGDEPEAEFEPQPSLAGLGTLIERVRAGGLPVDLEQVGTAPPGFSTSVDLTAYRVVQEALEAAQHPGGAAHATVAVRFEDEALEIEIVDDGAPGMSRQLLGLRERVRLYGGEVDAGPRDGQHIVRARLPLAEKVTG